MANGNSRPIPELSDQDIERFWSKVDRSGGPDDCWEWQGGLSHDGYGRFNVGGRNVVHEFYAHRVAWTIVNGPIPDGMFALHRCDNRRCCNATCLFLGTKAENGRDMADKGRSTIGERNPMAKLTHKQVCEMRKRHGEGTLSQRQLAREYGVSAALVCLIVNGKSWRVDDQAA